MLLSETFVFGSEPGMYPEGPFVQDSIFRDSRIAIAFYNAVPMMTGYIHNPAIARFDISTIGSFSKGDTLIINFYKY